VDPGRIDILIKEDFELVVRRRAHLGAALSILC
jgi:hypothetical protein